MTIPIATCRESLEEAAIHNKEVTCIFEEERSQRVTMNILNTSPTKCN